MHRSFQLLDSPSLFLIKFSLFDSYHSKNGLFSNQLIIFGDTHTLSFTIKYTHYKTDKTLSERIHTVSAHFLFEMNTKNHTLDTEYQKSPEQNRETFVQLKITICSETVKLCPFSDIPLDQRQRQRERFHIIAYNKWCVVIRIYRRCRCHSVPFNAHHCLLLHLIHTLSRLWPTSTMSIGTQMCDSTIKCAPRQKQQQQQQQHWS